MRRASWRATVGGALALSGLTAALGLGLAAPSAATAVVAPGGAVPVNAAGFGPDVDVVLQIAGRVGEKTVRAGADGSVHASYPAPQTAGQYQLLASGRAGGHGSPPPGTVLVGVPRVVRIVFRVGAEPSDSTSPPGSAATTPDGGPSDVATSRASSASSGGLGVLGESAGRSGRSGRHGRSGGAAPHGAGGTLSTTGADLRPLVAAGSAAVAAGWLLVLLGRRRRRH